MITAMWMLTMSALDAHAVTRELHVCPRFRKEFADADGGDWWTDNDDQAMTRGLRIIVTDDLGPTSTYASDSSGCAIFDVEVSGPDYFVDVSRPG